MAVCTSPAESSSVHPSSINPAPTKASTTNPIPHAPLTTLLSHRVRRRVWVVFAPVLTLLGLGLLWLAFSNATVLADNHIIYVKPNAVGSGGDWDDASSLQDALSAATSGDQIWVAQGIYIPGLNANSTFQLKSGVAIYGGFTGTSGTEGDFEARDWMATPSILTGDIENNDSFKNLIGVVTSTAGITGTNAFHVVTGNGVAETTVLDGFYVTAGRALGSLAFPCGACGGGISLTDSNPTLSNLVVSGNAAANGGGIYNSNSNPSVSHVTVSGNSATANGGGIFNSESNPVFTAITVTDNSAASGGGIHNLSSGATLSDLTIRNNTATNGGGIYNLTSSPTLTNVTILGNHSSTGGGGLYNNSSDARLSAVTVQGNTSDQDGGGMANVGGSDARLMNVIFTENSAVIDGGGLLVSNSNPVISGTVFLTNTAQRGGGAFNYFSTPTFTATVFISNTAQNGGGMYNAASNARVTASVFNENRADDRGGGMHNAQSGPIVANTIFSGNVTVSNIGIGGGMYNFESNPTLTEVIFAYNRAVVLGGGMHNSTSNPLVTDSSFVANTTILGGDGGGMSNIGSSPTISQVLFADNDVGDAGLGGGMYNGGASVPRVTNTTFLGNRAYAGGGMHNILASPIISNSIFFTNTSTNNGGGMGNQFEASPVLINVAFVGNATEVAGGAIANADNSEANLFNVVIAGNFSGLDGGGLYAAIGRFTLSNVTMTGNHSERYGGAIAVFGSELLVQNSVVWGNSTASSSPTFAITNTTPTIRYSLIEGGLPLGSVDEGGNLNGALNPRFVRPVDCGGDGICGDDPATVGTDESLDDDYGDLRLSPPSPAIDRGDNAVVPISVTTDLAGEARVVAVKVVTPTVDLGAFEAMNVAPIFGSTPPLTATQGVLYSYVISATDPNQPEDGALPVSVVEAPSWITYTATNRTLSGVPTNADVGDHAVVLQVQDSLGVTATQHFTIAVLNANDAPSFVSVPPLTAVAGVLYSYVMTTTDPDVGDTRTITAVVTPAWLTLTPSGNGNGTLSGTPTLADVGVATVALQVRDVGGLTESQVFSVTVSATSVATGSVVGKVSAEGAGVAGVTVTLECDSQNEACAAQTGQSTVTDAQGDFRFDSVPVGSYVLSFDPPTGFSAPAPRQIEVTAGQVTTVPEVALLPVIDPSTELLFLPRLGQ